MEVNHTMPEKRPNIADIMKNSIERNDEEYVNSSKKEVLNKDCKLNSAENRETRGRRRSYVIRAYDEGMVPPAHQRVYNGLRDAVGGVGKSGIVILQRVCENTGTSRTNVLRVIKYLEQYGFLKYEARPKEHCSFVSILK